MVAFSGFLSKFPVMYKDTTGRVWRPQLIIVFTLIAFFWVLSRFLGPLVPVWQALDENAFYLLNGTLKWGGGWTYFWGHMNTRLFDVLWAVVMGLPVLWLMFFDRH